MNNIYIQYTYTLRLKTNGYVGFYHMPEDIKTDIESINWAKDRMRNYPSQIIENIRCHETHIRSINFK